LAHVYCGQTAGWIKMPLGTRGVATFSALWGTSNNMGRL